MLIWTVLLSKLWQPSRTGLPPRVQVQLGSAIRRWCALVDTGYRGDTLTLPGQTAGLCGVKSWEIVRLERLAEQVAERGAAPSSFISDFELALDAAARDAAGPKSVVAYRYGLDFEPGAPSEQGVRVATGRWLSRQNPEAGGMRLYKQQIRPRVLFP